MNYRQLAELLDVEGFIESPSELHGLLCGRLAGGEKLSPDKLQTALNESLESDDEVIENALPSLQSLYQMSQASLEDSAFTFRPLLPDEDSGLEERVMALAEWSQGFLTGLGDSGLSSKAVFSDDVSSALKDLAAIAQADFEGEAEDDDEGDFVELEEYVRVAALLVFTELGHIPLAPNSTSSTLH